MVWHGMREKVVVGSTVSALIGGIEAETSKNQLFLQSVVS